MPLAAGARLGPYEILSPLGVGGMGEVYRARDARLNRSVAIKVLPDSLTADPDRLMRFRREAQVLAAINHPNIAHLYGLEESSGHPALVMELVEGPTLADRIAGGPIAVADALPIARQIAEALEAAHEQGIVHRDLKPGNIKVREDAVVKVLDFGLARLGSPDGDATSGSSQSPTITSPAITESGVLLGTAAYMAPEQARGKLVDKRADIWAFGCVLYEMLSARRLFAGESLSDTLASILTAPPDWNHLPASTPIHVRRLLQRCLEKDPKRRLRDIGEARLQLAGEVDETAFTPAATATPSRRWPWALAALALLTTAAAVALMVRTRPPSAVLPVMQTSIDLPAGVSLSSQSPVAISPDGSLIVFVGQRELRTDLYLQQSSAAEARVLAGTSGAAHPFFSPDGLGIGFFADGALQRIAVSGGAPIRIGDIRGLPSGGSWAPDGTIVFALRGAGLSKVNAAGGAIEQIPNTTPAAYPEFLPDGTILFTTGVASPTGALATIAPDGSGKRIVARMSTAQLDGPPLFGTGGAVAQGRFLENGFLVYGQSPGFVRALPVDPRSLAPTGPPVPLVDSVERGGDAGAVLFSVSRTGTLFYAGTGERHQLVWVDRAGAVTPISADRAAFREPRLSPDGRKVIVAINDDETRRSDLWIYDVERGTRAPFTTTAHNLMPQITHDGMRVAFQSGGDLFELPWDGGVERTRLMSRADLQKSLTAGTGAFPTSWSPDGQTLLVQGGNEDLFLFERGTAILKPLLVREAQDWGGQFSRNGRWITWTSTASGQPEVFVAPSTDLARGIVVSTDGGSDAQWGRDGHEIFYKRGDTLMSVALVESSGVLRPERPRALFTGSFIGAARDPHFDVAADGRRFVMIKSDERSTLSKLTVVQHWFDELERAKR